MKPFFFVFITVFCISGFSKLRAQEFEKGEALVNATLG